MENEQFTTLVNTLLNNNLASSLNEARRMAEEMIGTSQKVQDGYKKENHTYMVSNYSQKADEEQIAKEQAKTQIEPQNNNINYEMPQLKAEPARNNDSIQQSIQEIRERAINPQPVQVQVDFQTPNFDARQEVPIENNNQPAYEENNVQEQESTPFQTTTSQLAENLQVNIPGVDTTQTLNNLNVGATHTPNAIIAPNREKDDFLTVRIEASSEQTPISSPEESLQANAQPIEQTPAPEAPRQQFNDFGGLETGFPTQPATERTNAQPIQQAVPVQQEANLAPQPETNTFKAKTPERPEVILTAEEKQLREDCDLSKVFNFAGK